MRNHFYLLLLTALMTYHSSDAQVRLMAINVPYNQEFDSLATTGTSSFLPRGWLFSETGTNNNLLYSTSTGSLNAGDTYSFGSTGATERALGGLRSGSLIPSLGASFTNETGTTITSLQITYRGEQWRLGTVNRGADHIDFQYSTNATSLVTGTWTNVDELDFSSPFAPITGTIGALDGNQAAFNALRSFTIGGINIPSGATFFIRWTDRDVSGADDGLAVDNFTLTPAGIPPTDPSINFSPAALAFGEVNAGSVKTLQYEVIGSNLDGPITTTISNAAYSLSNDGTVYTSSITLPETGGFVHVRFAPVANGSENATISHTSGAYSKDLSVTGSGFIQASNIIPIAEARMRSAGTKVTVAGRITVSNQHGSPSFVQDATGGIPVFDFSLSNNVSIGDSVIVTGPVSLFNDQVQISGSGLFFTHVESAPRILAPKLIAVGELAANEGLLVTVQNVELVNKDFVFYPQSTERMTDGTTQADLRIDGDTNIPGLAKPQGLTNITGVVGRFRTNAQLLPRFEQDIPGASLPTTPVDNIPRSQTFDVVNWNVEFFGARKEDYRNQEFGPEDEALQLQNVKRVLDSLNADIIAVQEVSDEATFSELVSALGHYSYRCSPRYSYSFQGESDEFPPQKVCYLYDPSVVEVLSTRVLFESMYDSALEGHATHLTNYPGGSPSSFYSSGRLPYLLNVQTTLNGVTERISLINIHAKSGAAQEDYARRAYDAAVLKDTLDTWFAGQQVIVLGDLNDDLDQSISTGLESPYASFVNDTANYASISRALSDAGAKSTLSFNDVIDHQILTDDLQEEYMDGSVQIVAPFRYIQNYAATTSDHLPVISRYTFTAPVLEFAESGVTLGEDSVAAGNSSYTVRIAFNKPVIQAIQLSLIAEGDASYDEDYTTSPAAAGDRVSIFVPAGSSFVEFTVTVLEDTEQEQRENVLFTIEPPFGFQGGEQLTFDVAFEDNDRPSTIGFVENAITLSEDSAPGQDESYLVQIAFDKPVAQALSFDIALSGDATYENDFITVPAANAGRISIAVPAGATSAAFVVTVLDDTQDEETENTLFTIVPPAGYVGEQLTLAVAFEDNDNTVSSATVSFVDALASGLEGTGPYTVKLKLSNAVSTDQFVKLDISTKNHKVAYGEDFITEPAAIGTTLTVWIPAGNTEGSFTITPLTDKQEKPSEPVSFYLNQTSEGLIAENPRQFVFTIIDARKRPHFVIYPNPTHNICKLIGEDLEADESFEYELRGPQGEKLLRGKGTVEQFNNQLEGRIQNAKKGLYTLQLIVGDEKHQLRILKL